MRFKRLTEIRNVGVLTLEYSVLAKKAGSCAEYHITDTMPIPGNVQIQPILVVDPGGVHAMPLNRPLETQSGIGWASTPEQTREGAAVR